MLGKVKGLSSIKPCLPAHSSPGLHRLSPRVMTLMFQVCCVLVGAALVHGGYHLGTFGGQLTPAVKVIRITNTVAVPVPVPFPYPKHIPVPISVPKPLPYAVPHPVPVEVTKPFVIPHPVPLDIPKPYPVSYPSEQLTAPQFHPDQHNDYRGYITYGSQSGEFSSGQGNIGQESHGYAGDNADRVAPSQEGYSSSVQDSYSPSAQGSYYPSAQNSYNPSTQGGYFPTGQDSFPSGQDSFSSSGQGSYFHTGQDSLGTSVHGGHPTTNGDASEGTFENTNSLEDAPHSGHGK